MKKIIFIGFIFCLISCTITRKIKISYKTNSELIDFYKQNNIDNFLIPKDYNSLVELYKSDRVSVPQNIIFNSEGYEIEHFNEKLCANHTLEFLKTYNEDTKLKLSNYNIKDYLTNFKSVNSNINIENVLHSKKIRVFVNTATYAEKYKTNNEAYEIYKQFNDKYEIFIVNLDYNSEWEDIE